MNEETDQEIEVTREDIDTAAMASALLGCYVARPDGKPASAAKNWILMRDAADASKPHPLAVPAMSAWWREAFEAFRDTRTAVPMFAGAMRSSSSVRSPFSVDMIRALIDERAEPSAAHRSTDPGQP